MDGKNVFGIALSSLETLGEGKRLREVPKEFHISLEARKKYGFKEELFSICGNVVFANFRAAQDFAQAVNARRDTARHPEKAVKAGQINAMGLIDEILHYVVTLYRERYGSGAFREALEAIKLRIGEEKLRSTLLFFAEEFPPRAVYQGGLTAAAYLDGETEGTPNAEILLEELLLLWLANDNPAFAPFGELFDDTDLRGGTSYLKVIAELKKFFADQPAFGPQDQTLVEMLKAPALASPYSLPGQLGLYPQVLGPHDRKLSGKAPQGHRGHQGGGEGPLGLRPGAYPGLGLHRSGVRGRRVRALQHGPGLDAPRSSSSRRVPSCGSTSFPGNTTGRSRPSTKFPTPSSTCWRPCGITGLWFIGIWERVQGLPKDQGALRESRGRGFGLFALRLRGRPGARRLAGLGQPAPEGLGPGGSASRATWSPTTRGWTRNG